MGINIILHDADGQSPVFVEIENDSGESINIGTQEIGTDGYRTIHISVDDIITHEVYES